jgi:hypothetical protein
VRRIVALALIAGYFVAGAVIAAAGRAVRDRFALAFVATGWAVGGLTYLATLLAFFGPSPLSFLLYFDVRVQGLMDNPIAFGWLGISALTLHLAYWERWSASRPLANLAGLAILIAMIIVPVSKSAWVGAVVAVAALALARPVPWRALALAAAVGLGLAALTTLQPEAAPAIGPHLIHSTHAAGSVNLRADQASLAFELIKQHPLLGIGLGSFPWEEARNGLAVRHYLHSTPLALLTELGPAALLLVLGAYAVVLRTLWPVPATKLHDPFVAATFALLVAFGAMSLADDVLFQRFLWVFTGAALASVAAERQVARP